MPLVAGLKEDRNMSLRMSKGDFKDLWDMGGGLKMPARISVALDSIF